MKILLHSFSFIFLIWVSFSLLAEQSEINIIYPQPNQIVRASKNTFILGNIKPKDSTLFINNVKIPVYRTGGFLAYLPVTPEKFTFNCKLILKDGSELIKNIPIRLPITKKTKTTTAPVIERNNYLPKSDIGVLIGEEITFQCKTIPAKKVSCRLDKLDTSFILQENTQNGVKGIYRASKSFNTSVNESPIEFKVADDSIQSFTPSVKVTILPPGEYPVLEVVENNAKARFKPGKGYDTFLKRGSRLKSSGFKGSMHRAKLSNNRTIYVQNNQIKKLPSQSLIPLATAGNIYCYETEKEVRIKISNLTKVNGTWIEYGSINKLSLKLYHAIPDIDRVSLDVEQKSVRDIKWQQIEDDVLMLDIFTNFAPHYGYYIEYKNNHALIHIKKPFFKREYKDIRICIDPGHGGVDSGAIGPLGTTEKEVNLLQSKKLVKALKQIGFDVFMTREIDKGPALYERAPLAFKKDADIFISIHHNAPGDGVNPFKIRSTESFFYNEGGKLLGSYIHHKLLEVTKIKDAGLKYGNLAVCRNNAVPSVLLEIDYLVIPEAEERILTDKFRENVANAITHGVIAYVKNDK